MNLSEVIRCDPCAYCGAVMEEPDHIVPRSRGGEDTAENLTASCARCNQSKGARSLLMFLLERSRPLTRVQELHRNFGERMRFRRLELGMTQAELARALDTDTMAISRWERGGCDGRCRSRVRRETRRAVKAPRVSRNKDVNREAQILCDLGFAFTGRNSRSHPLFTHEQFGTVELVTSPGSRRWREGHRWRLARRLGMTLPQLEALIAGQAVIGKPRRPGGRKRSRPAAAARHLHVAPDVAAAPHAPAPEPVPVVSFEPADPITRARRAHWAAMEAERTRANLANPYPWRSAA